MPQTRVAQLLEDHTRDTTPTDARDATMIPLMAGIGLRRAEVCSLHSAGLDMEANLFKVVDKHNKERAGYLSGGALAAMQDWITVRGTDPGPIFCAISKSGG